MAGTRSETGCRGDRRGAAAVEFAIVLPVLITIALGCVDFGRFCYTYISVTNAAREGANCAARNPWTLATQTTWQTSVRLAVENELGCGQPGSPFQAGQIVIEWPTSTIVNPGKKTEFVMPTTTDPDGSKRVGVRVKYPFSTIITWPGIPASMTLQRTVQMRVFG